jgi:hypothetical protein
MFRLAYTTVMYVLFESGAKFYITTQSPSCLPCGMPISSKVAGPFPGGALAGFPTGIVAALGAGLGAGLGFWSGLGICVGGALPTLPGPGEAPMGRRPSTGTWECLCCCGGMALSRPPS